ncbi:JmjC-domain-containing protein [Calocera cornea HHB12733]|uniref:[histone H3]-trimethyl-L-lysine(9) demethylase n=1 Tax=Calocera cornea HHB12733 TaxID=1353952 RepID=A0A165FBV5_9BASI|nr:JmjC-domain-containing protein [Calocera cornea HHB12733]
MPLPSRTSSAESAIPPQPDHFYPSPFNRPDWRDPADPESCIWPEEDPAASRGIPVFKPTWDDFEDFEAYVTAIAPWGKRSGIVKVIPPKEWTDSLPSVVPQLADVRLRNPIAQEMIGGSGLFRQSNIEKRRTYSVQEWAKMCDKEESRTPSPSTTLKKERSEKKELSKKRKRRRVEETDAEDDDAREEKEVERGVAILSDHQYDAPPTPESLPDPAPRIATDGSNAVDKDVRIDENFFASFDPKTSWLPPDTKPEDYTPEVCARLDRNFWRSIGNLGSPAWYGADMKGSLFTDETTSWNVSKLPNPLSRLLDQTNRKLPGVNTPYLYFGMWRAAFAWHVEDMDLYSINYIHFGAPKLWWAIPSEKYGAFERTMKGYFPADAKSCSQFLRHKSFLVSPTVLANSSCRPNVLVQHQGEFVITFPHGYHAGINLGFNCAESVNFALQGWEDAVRKADWCKCEKDSVKLDVDALHEEAKEIQAKEARSAPPKESKSSKKRKIEETALEEEPKVVKRAKRRHSVPNPKQVATDASPSATTPTRACILCPGADEDTLLRVHDVPAAIRKLSTVHAWAHERCAAIIPETWVDTLDGEKCVFGVDVIEKARWDLKCAACTKTTLKNYGAKIQCTRGKCPRAFHVSCAMEKSEVQFKEVEEVEKEVVFADMGAGCGDQPQEQTPGEQGIPIDMEMPAAQHLNAHTAEVPIHDQEEASQRTMKVIKTIKKPIIELLCPVHNPDMRILAKQRKDEARKRSVLALKEGDRIRIRLSSGVFEVTLLGIDEAAEKVEVMWDDQSKREIKWGSIHWGAVSEEVLAASKAKQEAKEEALETKLRQYQEALRLAKKHRPILPAPSIAGYTPVQPSGALNGAVPAASNAPSSAPNYLTSVFTIPPSASNLAPTGPCTSSVNTLSPPCDHSASRPEEQIARRADETAAPSYIVGHPSSGTYPTGYWATVSHPGYWQHPSFISQGWYDYHGRWHEGPVPTYAHHESDGNSNSTVSTSPNHGIALYDYRGFLVDRYPTDVGCSAPPPGPNPALADHDAMQPGPGPSADSTASQTTPTSPSSNNAALPRSTSPEAHQAPRLLQVPPSVVLNNPDLVPLLNSLMQNETMRNTLQRLKETFSTQLTPPIGIPTVDYNHTDIVS